MAGSFKLVSWNIGGITSPIKRKLIISHLRKRNTNIAFLKETHLKTEEVLKLKCAWVKEVLASPSVGRKGGVAILLGKKLKYEILDTNTDTEGKLLMVKIKLAKTLYTLCNIYAPNRYNYEFWESIQAKILSYAEGFIILGGDFNMAPHYPLDRCRQNPTAPKTKKDYLETKMFKKIIRNLRIRDIWRVQNPDSSEFTCLSMAHKTLSRIDLFLLDERLVKQGVTAGILPICKSDHAPIFLDFQLRDFSSDRRRFLFPKFLASDYKFKNWLNLKFEEYSHFNHQHLNQSELFWETAKAVLRGEILAYSISRTKSYKLREKEVVKAVTNAYNRYLLHRSAQNWTRYAQAKKERDTFLIHRTTQKELKFQAKMYRYGNKSGKLLANLIKGDKGSSMIDTIQKGDKTVTSSEEILGVFTEYYQELYSLRKSNVDQRKELWDKISHPVLTPELSETLNSPISESELRIRRQHYVLCCKPSSGAGTGQLGIPACPCSLFLLSVEGTVRTKQPEKILMHPNARMEPWAAVLCAVLVVGIGGTSGEPKNRTSVMEGNPYNNEPDAKVQQALLENDQAKKPQDGRDSSSLDNNAWSVIKEKQSQKKPANDYMVTSEVTTTTTVGLNDDLSNGEITVKYHTNGITIENNESAICGGCSRESYNQRTLADRSLLAEHNSGGVEVVTGLIWPSGQEVVDKEQLPEVGTTSVTESQEDSGSGDQHVRTQPSQVTHSSSVGKAWDLGGFMGLATASPSHTTYTDGKGILNPSVHKVISQDSAEIDHLLQVSRETVLEPPSSSEPGFNDHNLQKSSSPEIGIEVGKPQEMNPVLEGVSKKSASQDAQGSTDMAMVNEDIDEGTAAPTSTSVGSLHPPEPPFDHHDGEPIDYYDFLDEIKKWGDVWRQSNSHTTNGDVTKKFNGKEVPQPRPELYDEFTPFEDSDFYPPTSFYSEGDEEGGIEDDEDDDIEEVDEVEDITVKPRVQTVKVNDKSTGKKEAPQHTFNLYGGNLKPKFHPEVNKDLTQTASGSSDNSTECRNGYVKRNNSCKSVCDIYPTYCYNGGQCYIVESTGAFCRCNTQDYIWHKGMRCESIITDFQVMCVAVGTAALVVLLLFMMTVFFAKKLYLLKTENYKLRKRKYRTPSELHNDNFSLSTIAEGSHPNVRKLCDTPSNLSPHARALAYYDNIICQSASPLIADSQNVRLLSENSMKISKQEDPNAPQKVQDLPKACLKDEEPFNIQNLHSPKHEGGKGDPDIVDVNCVLNNLT
ncbi:chondroitin sulfate proteoglycan 5 [Bombina bombina]|uniref:chondroitin sulfate proteoglycan 5 n=1 Tax=Bombina bombina TaxID=8345 RepID=UPI00235B1BED|nr:chondroitin sulfate proteoglycan 5 [Bombina bombina]